MAFLLKLILYKKNLSRFNEIKKRLKKLKK